jgi:hypothetical protein
MIVEKMFKTISLTLLMMCTSCTYSIVMNHSEGTTSDLVDTTQTPTTDATLTISGIPG